jgi:hypothetical protein
MLLDLGGFCCAPVYGWPSNAQADSGTDAADAIMVRVDVKVFSRKTLRFFNRDSGGSFRYFSPYFTREDEDRNNWLTASPTRK